MITNNTEIKQSDTRARTYKTAYVIMVIVECVS